MRAVPPDSRRIKDRLSETDLARIAKRYVPGEATVAVLAAEYEISDYSLRMILRKAGVGPGRHHVPREISAQAVALRAEGESIRKIADELGVSQTTVRLIVAAKSI